MRNRFEEELEQLNKDMMLTGALCESAIAMAAKALLEGDVSLAQEVHEVSEDIDQREYEIESLCMQLLMSQQPVARDLRTISASLKMVTDMKRIGVQSMDIADLVATGYLNAGSDYNEIHEMAVGVIHMFTASMDAFVKKDPAIAEEVIAYDDQIDLSFKKMKQTLIERFSQPQTDGEAAIDLLMSAKYLEKIGDHAVNIANWVLFSITGHKEEETS